MKLVKWLKEKSIATWILIVGVVLFFMAGNFLGSMNDQRAPVDMAIFMYMFAGVINLGLALLFVWLVGKYLLPTLMSDLDLDEFPSWWKETRPEVKVCAALLSVLWLFYCCLYALHP